MEGFDRGWRDPEETADSESKWPMREWGGSWDVSSPPFSPFNPFSSRFLFAAAYANRGKVVYKAKML